MIFTVQKPFQNPFKIQCLHHLFPNVFWSRFWRDFGWLRTWKIVISPRKNNGFCEISVFEQSWKKYEKKQKYCKFAWKLLFRNSFEMFLRWFSCADNSDCNSKISLSETSAVLSSRSKGRGAGNLEVPSSKCVLFWFFSIQLLNVTFKLWSLQFC